MAAAVTVGQDGGASGDDDGVGAAACVIVGGRDGARHGRGDGGGLMVVEGLAVADLLINVDE